MLDDSMIILGMCQTYPKYIYCFRMQKIECQITNNKYGTEFLAKIPETNAIKQWSKAPAKPTKAG